MSELTDIIIDDIDFDEDFEGSVKKTFVVISQLVKVHLNDVNLLFDAIFEKYKVQKETIKNLTDRSLKQSKEIKDLRSDVNMLIDNLKMTRSNL